MAFMTREDLVDHDDVDVSSRFSASFALLSTCRRGARSGRRHWVTRRRAGRANPEYLNTKPS